MSPDCLLLIDKFDQTNLLIIRSDNDMSEMVHSLRAVYSWTACRRVCVRTCMRVYVQYAWWCSCVCTGFSDGR